MFQVDKKPILFNKELSGGVITFNSRLKNMSLSKCKITIPISQQGSGTPSPDNIREFIGFSSVDFTKAGKNLFSGQNITENVYISSNGDINHYADWNVSDYILVSANTAYTFTPNSTSGNKAHNAFYDSNKNLLGVSPTSNFTFTTPENCKFVRLSFRSLSYDIQFEHGDTATVYEPYNSNTFTILFGQTVYGGELDVLTGIFTVTTIFYKPTSAYNVGESGGVTFFRVSIPKPGVGSGVGGRVFCNVLKQNQQQYSLNSCRISTGGVILQIVIDQTITSVEGATQWLIDNDCTFVYELAEPIEVILEGHTIEAIKGINNIFANIGTTTVGYVEVK